MGLNLDWSSVTFQSQVLAAGDSLLLYVKYPDYPILVLWYSVDRFSTEKAPVGAQYIADLDVDTLQLIAAKQSKCPSAWEFE